MGTGLTALGQVQVNVSSSFFGIDGETGTQADPAVTTFPSGVPVVVYENPQAGGSNIDLVAQVPGGDVGGRSPIDQTADVTVHPAIATAPQTNPFGLGGFVVAYTDVTQNTIVVRSFDILFGISAPFVVDNGNGPLHQPNVGPVDNAAIATFADGTILVAWEFDFAHSATDHDVYFAYLNSTASGFVKGVTPLDVHNAFEGEARVATSGNTGAIVYAGDPGTINGGQDIILTLWNSAGTELATPATIFGTSSSEVFSHPDVAALSDGRFVIAAHDDTAGNVQVAFYNPVTHAVTSLPALTLAGASPHVAGLPNGGFILSFDTTGGDIGELRVDPDGSTQFTAGLANSFTTGIQSQNAVAANAFGSVFFAWQDAGPGNPHSTDTDTRIEGQTFHLQLPTITSNGGGDNASLSIPENTTSVTTVTATDSDSAATLIYSIVGGADAGQFTINGSSGALSFVTAPNFEVPTDSDHNNSYIVTVHASDGGGFDNQTITVNVTNVSETPVHWIATSDMGTHPAGYVPFRTGDFNLDGTTDILWYNSTTNDVDLWKIGNAQWAGSVDIGTHPAGYNLIARGDYNHDGNLDLLWFNPTSGDVDIWKLQNGQWTGSADVGPHPPGAQALVGGDFNGDGTRDLLWYNASSNSAEVWMIQNAQWAGSVDIGAHPAGWQPLGTDDIDHDGTSDVVWYNPTTRDIDVWKISNGHWAGSIDIGTHPAGYAPAGIGDFNNDGSPDVLWFNQTTGDAELWLLQSGHWMASVDLGSHPTGWSPAGLGDFNHDGNLDILWRDPATNHVEAWLLSNS
jgi:hypothetical protein